MSIEMVSLIVLLAPLLGSLAAGLFGKRLGVVGSHRVTIGAMIISCVACAWLVKWVVFGQQHYDHTLYHWIDSGDMVIGIGFLLDSLSVMLAFTVTFVSLWVHVYSIGYMKGELGYQRFFCYVSLFTFAMLNLVMTNNLLQLFFGWEGVGMVSYLLIGFYFDRPAAVAGGLKAFIVNRVGDFGFLLALAMIFMFTKSLHYADVFKNVGVWGVAAFQIWPGYSVSVAGFVCLFLFVGAMGKSAQIPLHVWLPESMEGPTPISALIHAATMVTAGVFMIARMSPIFELTPVILNLVLIIGASGAFFLGLVGIVQMDIKRVIAYSTLSQLGYMVAATGASAYTAGVFHLLTHACFKALLFLGAGSVIIGMHHDQDMRHMGNARRYMPITTICFIIGGLALCAFPPFAGFYSKDAIITAVGMSTLPGAGYAYICLLLGAWVTAVYTFRLIFLTFFGEERSAHKPKESSWTVTLPLIMLAIPSLFLGGLMVAPLFAGMDMNGSVYLGAQGKSVMVALAKEYAHPLQVAWMAVGTMPFWLVVLGIAMTWVGYIRYPMLPRWVATRFAWVYSVLLDKYGFDRLYQQAFVRGAQGLARGLYRIGDGMVINGCVQGLGMRVVRIANRLRALQSGYLYHYAAVMVLGIVLFAIFIWLHDAGFWIQMTPVVN